MLRKRERMGSRHELGWRKWHYIKADPKNHERHKSYSMARLTCDLGTFQMSWNYASVLSLLNKYHLNFYYLLIVYNLHKV
jgi:hypothetical protein